MIIGKKTHLPSLLIRKSQIIIHEHELIQKVVFFNKISNKNQFQIPMHKSNPFLGVNRWFLMLNLHLNSDLSKDKE